MKIKFLFNDFVPQKKCGADPVSAILIGSGITGGAGLLGNILGSTVGYNQQSHMLNKQMDNQRAENQLNRDWQTVEAEKNRVFQSSMLGQQNQLQKDLQAQQAFYQSPVYQREQLTKAHLNPQVYFGSSSSFGGSSAPSAPSAPNGSMPGSVGGLSPIGFQPTDLQIPSLLSGIGNLISSVGSAKKSGVETKILEESMFDYLAKVHEEGKQAQIQTDILNLHRAFQSSTMPDRVKHVEQDLANAIADGELLKSKNESEKAQKLVNDAIVRMDNAITQLKGEEFTQLKLLWPLTRQKLSSDIGLNRAKSNEANASAENQRANAALTRWQESFNRSNNDILVSKLDQELRNLEKEGAIMDWQVDAAKSAAKIAQVNADHAEALFWKDFIMDIVTNGFDAFLGYKNSKSWERLSKSSQSRAESRIKELEMQYGDSYTDEYTSYDPQGVKHTYKAKYNRGRASKAGK